MAYSARPGVAVPPGASVAPVGLAATGAHQQQPHGVGGNAFVDGNEGLRAAKRRRPTDRSLPSFSASARDHGITHQRLQPSTDALESMSDSYSKLQQIERKLDWHVSRRKTEISERMAGTRVSGARRTLRVHVTATLSNQPWQISSNPDEAPQPNYQSGDNVPKIDIKVTGEILGATTLEPKLPLTHYISRAVIETDRDPTLYDRAGPFEASALWQRPAPGPQAPSGLSVSLSSSIDTQLRISLFLDHRPERFALVPPVATLLDLPEADRPTILQALWAYVKAHNLQDEDKRHIRTDASLRPLFDNQDRVMFHHLPEYVNRFMMPLQPVMIEHTIHANEAAGARQHAAFDFTIYVPDPARLEIEQVYGQLMAQSDKIKEIMSLDERQIAAEAATARTSNLKRTFLASFASSPADFLQQFVASQAQDLDLVLGTERAKYGSIGGVASWREAIRTADAWQGGWVNEGAALFDARRSEKRLRETR
ncbi:SWI/SNF and RSC complex subunit Ssr3 [Microbotryomycetes sp. JL201]|nr:SWI/SNF and RSC complex subunit Ssr3 [Microbotryomycetes sp. JL201]